MKDLAAALLCVAIAAAGGSGCAGERRAEQPSDAAAAGARAQRVIRAGPADYAAKVRALRPGDTLLLSPGLYAPRGGPPGLTIDGLHGKPGAPIVVSGPDAGAKPVFVGTASHNTVRLRNASHVVIRNLEIDGRDLGGDGVKAEGPTRHVTLENLTIRGVGRDQSVVGISTAGGTAAHWVIRGSTIVGAGTGMYLGNSDGTHPFVAGLVEGNLVRDTIGYNVQVKHQLPWSPLDRLPPGPTLTVIRHNVFAKGTNSATGELARPNLLVGDVPLVGPGSHNGYAIYGNLFHGNPSEALFQGEGNIGLYANVLVNDAGPAMRIQKHNGIVRRVDVFGNTVVAAGPGIVVRDGDPAYRQRVVANAVFASEPIAGAEAQHNATGMQAQAVEHLRQPSGSGDEIDLRPQPGHLTGPLPELRGLDTYPDWNADFDGRSRNWGVWGAHGAGPPERQPIILHVRRPGH